MSGAGFPAGSVLAVDLFSDPVRLGSTTADAAGAYRLVVLIPLGTAPGGHTIQVSDVNGTLTARTSLVVPVPASALINPGSLSRTGADVRGPALLALALVLAGSALVGLSWTGRLSFDGLVRQRPWPRRRWF